MDIILHYITIMEVKEMSFLKDLNLTAEADSCVDCSLSYKAPPNCSTSQFITVCIL